MCLILIGWRAHGTYPLVVAANRDEFHERPTEAARFWDAERSLLAGRDLRAGGTWLGVTRSGRFAAVTNYRTPASAAARPRSRGDLVRGFLESDATAEDYARAVAEDGGAYGGFNLLVADRDELVWVSNHGARGPVRVEPGVHGLSNGALDAPWPKVRRGVAALEAALPAADEAGLSLEALLVLLSDRTVPGDEELPDTGVGLELERVLSPMFVTGPRYGTRSSTVLALERGGRVSFIESSFDSSGAPLRSRGYSFSLRA